MVVLIFYAGKNRYALDSTKIIEVVPMVAFKPLPHAPTYVAGIFNYRGKIVPVVDLSALIAGASVQPLLSSRTVLVEYSGMDGRQHILGLLAERVTETISCSHDDFSPPGIVLSEAPYLGEVFLDEDGMIQRIEVEKILPENLRRSLFTMIEQDSDVLP